MLIYAQVINQFWVLQVAGSNPAAPTNRRRSVGLVRCQQNVVLNPLV
jgi:hypothetical protein